jgi:hypothetical protein
MIKAKLRPQKKYGPYNINSKMTRGASSDRLVKPMATGIKEINLEPPSGICKSLWTKQQ